MLRAGADGVGVMADHAAPIRAAVAAVCKPLCTAPEVGDAIQTQAAVAATQHDLLDTFREAGTLLVQVEGAAELLAEHARRLRQAILDGFLESGAAGVETEHHSIGWSEGTAGAVVTGDVPPEWMTTPAPRPDLTKIAKALRAGQTVPGASLRNAAPHLTVRAKKKG